MAQGQSQWHSELVKLPGYSAAISLAQCNSIFPHHQIIEKQLQLDKKTVKFNLYAFTAVPFDKHKESIVVIDGGPGSLRNPKKAHELAGKFSKFNLIYFHYRGGGCSFIPDSDPAVDKFITPQHVVEDLESIRSAYKINVWQAAFGLSYGTDIARLYAKQNPEHLKSLILDGLSASFTAEPQNDSDSNGKSERVSSDKSEKSAADETYAKAILSSINARKKTSDMLQDFDASAYQKFVTEIEGYLKIVSPYENYYLMGYWEYEKENFLKHLAQQKIAVPRFLSRKIFAAVTRLIYTGDTGPADDAILVLLSELGYIEANAEEQQAYEEWVNAYTYYSYPFLNPLYTQTFLDATMISIRVKYAMNASSQVQGGDKLCNKVQTLVINGTDDGATPVENVDAYLKDKKCASHHENYALIVQGGGHGHLSSNLCVLDFVQQLTDGKKPTLKSCSDEVVFRKY